MNMPIRIYDNGEFDKRIGRKIALTKALNCLTVTKTERKQIWNKYFTLVKDHNVTPNKADFEIIKARGIEVFGSRHMFDNWYTNYISALSGVPREILSRPGGLNILLNELGRIEHGIFA